MKAETKGGNQLTMQKNSAPGAQFQNIVMIYDPKCKHSQAFKAEFVKFANLVQSEKRPLNVIAINDGSATKKVIPGTFEVQGYPSILLFKNDKD